MATRLIFLCAGATASSRVGAFPSPDEPLGAAGARRAAAFRWPGRTPDMVFSSPSRAAVETGAALGLEVRPEPVIADLDFGDWSGRTLVDVQAVAPEPLLAWLADPTRATPGGETMDHLVARVGRWIDARAGDTRTVLAISHAAVIRAAIAHVLAAPLAGIMRVDVAPLSLLTLSYHGQWRLQELRRSDRAG